MASKHSGGNELPQRHATMVIDLWFELDHPEPFRARLTSLKDDASESTITYAGSREAVLSGVSAWVHTFPDK